MSRVLVLEADYQHIEEKVERALAEFPLDLSGKRVLVKPNMLGPYPPESHVNTHPPVVEALVKLLLRGGAAVTVGDNTGTQGYGALEKSARVSGIKDASSGCYENISSEAEEVRLPGKETTVRVSRKVLDADLLVSVPKFKTHTFTRITGAVKNSFGYLVGGDKARLHLEYRGYDKFSEALVDVYRIRPPDLVFMDAVVGMQGTGPTNGSLCYPGKVLVSPNGVELDSVMSHMMGIPPSKVKMLRYAEELGLGRADLSRIEIEGDPTPLKRFRRPVPTIPQLFGGTWIAAFFPEIGHPRFDVSPELCNSCGTCRDACPAGAITMVDGTPTYDYSKCVSCYCCMELCPQRAISLRKTLRTRLYRLLGYIQ